MANFLADAEVDPAVLRNKAKESISIGVAFYFMKAGLYVSLPALVASLVTVAVFLAVKAGCKVLGVWPLTLLFRFERRQGAYTTLLMSTGLTFGTISSLFGLEHGIIDQSQYTVLVTVVILSAVVPTLIAHSFFRPRLAPLQSPSEERENEDVAWGTPAKLERPR
ncbi:MAG: cation:proton antiporter [Bacillota bacterium]